MESKQSLTVETIEDYELENIPDVRKHFVAAMILAGFTNTEIEQKTEFTLRQIKYLQKDRNFQRTLQLASAKIFDSAIARLCLNSAKAVDVVVSILDNPDSSDRTKLQAAKIILDVAGQVKSAQLEQRLEQLESMVNNNAQL